MSNVRVPRGARGAASLTRGKQPAARRRSSLGVLALVPKNCADVFFSQVAAFGLSAARRWRVRSGTKSLEGLPFSCLSWASSS
jgi:hypothetical protein